MRLIVFIFCIVQCAIVLARIKPYRTTVTTSREILKEYDFIIVGGGSAGALLANRLSEVCNWHVLLVEAGEDEAFLSDIPIISLFLQNTYYNWKYSSLPQKDACLAYINNQCKAPTGKVLGGSSVLGDMTYSRGHPRDYDDWASQGNPGWSFNDVLPFFKKSEKNLIPEYENSTFHNREGEQNVERIPFRTPLASTFLEAGQELGYDIVDYNSDSIVGFSYLQVNMINGTRCSSNRAFLSKASKRLNLDVVILARVTKVIIDDATKQATGVEFVKKNRLYSVKAKKEVILSAGVFNSAQLLMVSGVGPQSHLQDLGIPVVQDLPVGQTMRHHYGFLGLMFHINTTDGITMHKAAQIDTFVKYLNHDGVLTIPANEALALIKTRFADDERPDVEFVFVPTSPANYIALKTLGIRKDVYESYFQEYKDSQMWSLGVFLLRPKSEGFVKLRSKDPYDPPLIHANYFSNESDADVLVEAIKEALRLSNTKAFSNIASRLVDKKVPGCECQQALSDEYWRCAVRQLTLEVHHHTGTCPMGPHGVGVVDERLRVHGVASLRVVDASVIPVIMTGHTNAPTQMVAEKAAELIKMDWLQSDIDIRQS